MCGENTSHARRWAFYSSLGVKPNMHGTTDVWIFERTRKDSLPAAQE